LNRDRFFCTGLYSNHCRTSPVVRRAVPGETVTYTLRLTHTGTTPAAFFLAVRHVTPGWVVAGLAPALSLDRRASTQFPLRLTIPRHDRCSDRGICTLIVTGTHDAHASSYLQATVVRGLIDLPAVLNGK